MKKRLLILSDLWGIQQSDWIKHYTERLEAFFDIQYYDVCDLGQIETHPYLESHLHTQFKNGGIDTAAKQLFSIEKNHFVNILAFSVGGTIGWKAGLLGLNIDHFFAVSATRLRYETIRPDTGFIKCYFGEYDGFRPKPDWFNHHSIPFHILEGKDHEMYREKVIADEISEGFVALFDGEG